ncbi:MAG: rhomboid family intramembrane serine protease, partial [Planctomycetes bacterium]|nr:rhomboid family intramembrane serine protease [Planctomycetota bacterium]
MLPHVDVLHLAFNLYWVWVFGTQIETVYGSFRTVSIILLLAVGSAMAEYSVAAGGVGLSGVGYGFFGFLWVLCRRDPRFDGTIDHRTIQLFIGWFFLCVILTASGAWHVGNVAHGSGGLLGALLGFAVVPRSRHERIVARALLAASLLVIVVGGTIGRPYVNLVGAADRDLAFLGYEALKAGDYEQAARLYRRAVARRDEAGWWYNLGIAYEHLGDDKEATDSYQRAFNLAPHDSEFKKALASWKADLADKAQSRGDAEEAVRLYNDVIRIDPSNHAVLYDLGIAYHNLGRLQEAVEAFEKAVTLDKDNA